MKTNSLAAAAALCFAFSAPTHAIIINSSFELGLFGWDKLGDVSVQTAAFGTTPTHGSKQAILSTLCDETVASCQTSNREVPISGTSAILDMSSYPSSVYFDFVGARLGDGELGFFGEASAIRQFFFAHGGSTLSFDTNYMSMGGDSSLFVLRSLGDPFRSVGTLGGMSGVEPTATSNVQLCKFVLLSSGSDSCALDPLFSTTFETGYSIHSVNIPTTGIYSIGFLVWEPIPTGAVPSALAIDNLRITVPEPSTLLLGVLALVLVSLGYLRSGLVRATRDTYLRCAN